MNWWLYDPKWTLNNLLTILWKRYVYNTNSCGCADVCTHCIQIQHKLKIPQVTRFDWKKIVIFFFLGVFCHDWTFTNFLRRPQFKDTSMICAWNVLILRITVERIFFCGRKFNWEKWKVEKKMLSIICHLPFGHGHVSLFCWCCCYFCCFFSCTLLS